jgi:DNA repair protein RadD
MDEFFLEELNEITIGSDGDYQENELGRLMSQAKHLDSIKKAIDNHCQESKHICIFCCTISHAQKVHDLIYGSTIVHSQLTLLERSGNMSVWKSGQIKVMVSVNILLEGFDFPALDTLIFARPTLSSNLYIQAIGRVVRISPGKTKAMLIDLTNNTNYFGADIDNIKVSISKRVEKEIGKEEELSTEKRCPQCQKEIHKALKTCIYCGYEFENVIEYINNLPELKDIKFKKDEEQIELYPVVEMFMSRHQKEGKPDSVKVEYRKSMYGYDSVKEFLCFDHGGYAAKKAKEWWMKMSFGLTPPENVDIALEQIKNIVKPTQIKIQKEGKYWRVIEYIFDETAFYGECNN